MPNMIGRRLHRSLLIAIFGGIVCAQSSDPASLSGTVVDPSGAVIPEATVKVTSTRGGAERRAKTGPDGEFFFPQLSAGRYQLEAAAPGFATSAREVVYEGAPVHLRITLSTAGLTTEMNVSA